MQTTSQSSAQYLAFQLAGDDYAVGVLRVREIIQYGGVTRVPRTPAWVRGVINLRGRVVPVVDLAVRFGLPMSAATRSSCIVIMEVATAGQIEVMGVLTDGVSQVIDLAPADVQPPPPFGTRVRVDCLIGLGQVGERLVLLLDVDKALGGDDVAGELAARGELLASGQGLSNV